MSNYIEALSREGKARDPFVLICTPAFRRGAYVIDRFLLNLCEIQRRYPSSCLLLATAEEDFVKELESLLGKHKIAGQVVRYKTEKPAYAKSRIWNIACGREATRRYMLDRTDAEYMLCLDADMTYDPRAIEVLLNRIHGVDLVHSGYPLRLFGIGLSGTGCTLLTRKALQNINFRCCEFRNGHTIPEDLMLEVDMFKRGYKTRRGFFLTICHFNDEHDSRCITPHRVGLMRRFSNHSLVRYVIIRLSLLLRYNITLQVKYLFNKLFIRRDIQNPVKAAAEDESR